MLLDLLASLLLLIYKKALVRLAQGHLKILLLNGPQPVSTETSALGQVFLGWNWYGTFKLHVGAVEPVRGGGNRNVQYNFSVSDFSLAP